MNNVPDDWGMYYTNCGNCGSRYHLSEGYCDCLDREQEEKAEETISRLMSKGCVIEAIESEKTVVTMDDDLGNDLRVGSPSYLFFIKESDGYDELCFSEESYKEITTILADANITMPKVDEGTQ